jgi:dipeptidyl aminopeptidase/acylaminoacyl peptidase
LFTATFPRPPRWTGWVLYFVISVSTPICAPAQSNPDWVQDTLNRAAQELEVPMVGGEFGDSSGIAISRDGLHVAYVETTANIAANSVTESLWLIDRGNSPRKLRVWDHKEGAIVSRQLQFAPDSKRISYLDNKEAPRTPQPGSPARGITVESLDTADKIVIPLPESNDSDWFVATGVRSYAWSPDGTQIAVSVQRQARSPPLKGVEITSSEFYSLDPTLGPTQLHVYQLDSKKWTPVSRADIDVDSFDWSPHGDRLVFAGSVGQLMFMPYMYNHLYITDAKGLETVEVPTEKGALNGPVWSLDGQRIAFRAQHSDIRWLASARLGLYDLRTHKTTYPAFDELGRISGFGVGRPVWLPHEQALLVSVPYHLSNQLFKVSIPDGKLTQFSTGGEASIDAFKVSGNDKVVLLTDSFDAPPGLFQTEANRFTPQRLVDERSAGQVAGVKAQQLSWPAGDRRWVIHGWLLFPNETRYARPWPLLVYAEGGPEMVAPSFRIGGYQYPLRALVAGGVAVLIPNSRGRAGYGKDFEATWQTENDPAQGPLSDDLEGVDALVKTGVADPNRTALAGHSWGGYLAAYALTTSTHFRTVMVHEAVSLNPLDVFDSVANPAIREFAEQLGMLQKGMTPFDEPEAQRLRELSPVYRAARSNTPALLEFGANGGTIKHGGAALFQGLTYFGKAPVELISYPRTGHVTEEPVLKEDAARRDLEWFAYWVLGKPTARMLERYGPPSVVDVGAKAN